MENKKAERKKGGRPKKADPDKRGSTIGIRFSKSESTLIKLKAEKAGISASDYVRQSAKKSTVNRMPTPEEIQLFKDFTAVSNNLNQLTKEAHKQNLAMIGPSLLKTMSELNRILKEIDNKNQDR